MLDVAGAFDSVDAHVDLGRERLTAVVEEFFGTRRMGDLALLYYSGHGLMGELDRESVFLAATDTRREQLHTTAVDTDGVLRHLLNITRASQKVVLTERDIILAGHRYDIMTSAPAATVALIVDDPEGDADGRGLRKVLAWIDVAATTVTVRRVPVWRCYTEPDLVVAELAHEGLTSHLAAPTSRS